MSGFLHGLSDTQPPDRLVAPLRPALWRSNLERAPLARVKRLGARYSVALSGLWGYPMEGWRGRGPPWERPREWERFVRGLARSHRRESLIWEVWNEPDVRDFWDGGRQRFLRLYALSERILREELGPGAVVGGPSISRYSRSWLRGFLRFCERAGCRPDFLAWHELLPPDQPIGSVAEHLRDARRELPLRQRSTSTSTPGRRTSTTQERPSRTWGRSRRAPPTTRRSRAGRTRQEARTATPGASTD